MLEDGAKGEISSVLSDVVHVFVDASFEPRGGFCGIGGNAYSSSGLVLHWFGCKIDPLVIDELWSGMANPGRLLSLSWSVWLS